MLELRHLRTLIALDETGSISLAAQRVHLTQSALSHQIRALQEYYQLPIIQRSGHVVRLSDAGKRLVKLAERCWVKFSQQSGIWQNIATGCRKSANRAGMPHLFRLVDANHG